MRLVMRPRINTAEDFGEVMHLQVVERISDVDDEVLHRPRARSGAITRTTGRPASTASCRDEGSQDAQLGGVRFRQIDGVAADPSMASTYCTLSSVVGPLPSPFVKLGDWTSCHALRGNAVGFVNEEAYLRRVRLRRG